MRRLPEKVVKIFQNSRLTKNKGLDALGVPLEPIDIDLWYNLKESLFMAGGQCTKSTYGQAERPYSARGCCVLLLHVIKFNIRVGGIICN